MFIDEPKSFILGGEDCGCGCEDGEEKEAVSLMGEEGAEDLESFIDDEDGEEEIEEEPVEPTEE